MIFISEDKKADWLQHIEGIDGKKILGARHELKRELYKEANVNHFLIYDTKFFMRQASHYLQIKFEEKTLENIKQSIEENHQTRLEEDDFNNEFEQFEILQHVFEQSENIQRMLEQYKSLKHVFEPTDGMKRMFERSERIQRALAQFNHTLDVRDHESNSPYLQKDIEDKDDDN